MRMINRFREWVYLHRTAKYRLARQAKSIEFWMNEAMQYQRMYEEVAPSFVWVEEGNGVAPTVPNDAGYLGECPPIYSEHVDESIDKLHSNVSGKITGKITIITPHEGPGL